ncbi:DNA annealing helicase and endonuclease ZRANB3 [Selaginella moellendorffii]|uniref:DNA annealing helicase and endonuclease ZRANB3 n=1 Tax=Selaginella moellendorffii TaxID=88036 RepID=UPI000D1C3929|nr:DNA annealing helicase and endonuclease ZRANB3 [Selaginella moellendorffii]|eukprot:XP_024542351.1 DNA annealing helicase and endonuclease ZRANB3 [Selaginella moellendorffii]
MEISEEQRRRMEANRAAALARRQRSSQNAEALANSGEKCDKAHLVSLEICSASEFFVVPPHSCCSDVLRRVHHWLESVPPLCWKSCDYNRCPVYRLRDYEVVTDVLQRLPGVKLEHIPLSTRNSLRSCSHQLRNADQWLPFHPRHAPDSVVDKLLLGLPWKLKQYLLPFQWDGIRYGLRRGGRVLIADEMGLGKTLQAIAIAACYLNDGPLLVVCPASLRLVWAEELERWLPFLSPSDVHLVFGREDDLKDLKTPKVVVISYNMLRRLRESILRCSWETVIVDESHNIRCSKRPTDSEETTALMEVARAAPRAVFLSGTPSLSRPFDIFNQVNALWPGILGKNKYNFARNYCSSSSDAAYKDYQRGVRLEELNILLREIVMIRRLKDQILTQLPPKRRQIIRLRLSSGDMLEAKASIDADGDERQLNTQEIGIAKLKGVTDWLSNNPFSAVKEEMQKLIIFCHHHKVMNSLQEFIVSKEIEFIRIDGHTDAKDRQKATEIFRQKDEVKVAIVGVTAGGVGLDLSAARNVVFVELPKTASELVQAEDRAHRRGQKSAVNIYIFCAKETSDECHWQSLSKSLERVTTMTNGSEDAIPGLEVETLMDQTESGDTKACSLLRRCQNSLPPDEVPEGRRVVSETAQQNASNESWNFDAHLLMFEVSSNTGRVHLYKKSLEEPPVVTALSENFKPEDLEKLEQIPSTERNLLLPTCLLENTSLVDASMAFIREWKTLRPVHRKRLYGRPLQLPLSRALSRLTGAQGGLVKGGSKRRRRPIGELACPLPDGASWRDIYLSGNMSSRPILQAWTADDNPLCKLCHRPCTRQDSREPTTLEDLFCKSDCFEEYMTKTSSHFMREKLFRLERGVCVTCNLDCHALVECIRNLDVNLRSAYILKKAPAFGTHETLLQNLVEDPIEGNAWHADHIVPVFAGGGECDLENMRTLCVVCHAQVTSEQCRKRHASFRKAQRALQFTVERLLDNKRLKSEEVILSETDDDKELLGIEVAGSAYSKQTG